ncbi:hypothetical protein ACFL6S_02455 [Candidatus Poribacteria bacterium]
MVLFVLIGIICNAGFDEMGVREFSEAPEPGVHPRVYLSPDDIPELRHRLENTQFGTRAVSRIIKQCVDRVESGDREFAELDLSNPSKEIVEEYFRSDAGRNRWGVAALDAFLRDDAELKKLVVKVITNYARIILASREFLPDSKLWQMSWNEFGSNWDLSSEWTFGSTGLPIAYDFLYNDMTEEQRSVVRNALATILADRRSWGMGWPATRTFSNWCPLHGNMLIMALAIEGEEGYDPELYELWRELIKNWFDHAVYPSGADYEDDYTFYALREGSSAMLAMARRGDNFFRHPHYQALLRWAVQFKKPFGVYDGYPNFFVIGKYANPDNPVANYIWRRYIGDDYDQNFRWQNFLELVLFGMDWEGDPAKPADMGTLELEKEVFYPRRGLMIARNDWSPEAMYVQFDAQPDAMFAGHDRSERGSFEIAGLGRVWAPLSLFHTHLYSHDHSLIHIDGKAEAYKAPSVKFLDFQSTAEAVLGVADLKYAYDWQWSPPWAKKDTQYSKLWEHEMSDPRDLGWPGDEDWMPHKLYGLPDFGFIGMYMWRRPYNPVEKAFRTLVFVRGDHPYALIIDDVKKDEAEHLYEWYLHLETDLGLAQIDHADIILKKMNDEEPVESSRKLLVRVLQSGESATEVPSAISARLEQYQAAIRRDNHILAKRLVIPNRCILPDFRILLMPFRDKDEMPETQWNQDHTRLTVRLGEQVDVFTLEMDATGRTQIGMTRNARRILPKQ